MNSLRNESGYLNVLTIPLVISVLLLISAAIFGFWAYGERQDYKDNSDKKVAAAVQEAVQRTQDQEAKRYAEEAKKPLKPYTGPSQYGSIKVEYPKTWSAYTINKEGSSSPVDWYLHPNTVPDTSNRENAYALRIEVSTEAYDRALDRFTNAAEKGEVTVQPYSLPEVPKVVGARVNGAIDNKKKGSMILLPLRDQLLKIWTESTNYLPDFNSNILPHITFSP